MAIYRGTRPASGFTQIRNRTLRDSTLSYRARGILAVILSHDDGWDTNSEKLAEEGTEGRDAVRSALSELETAGYLQRVRRQDGRGRWSTQAVVYDEPVTVTPRTEQGELFGPPMTDSQASVDQSSVSQAITTEHHLEHGGSTNPAKPLKPEARIATAAYEALGKMGNFMAMQQVARQALRAGHEEAAVLAATMALIEEGRPMTGQALSAKLRKGHQGGTLRDTNHDHWNNGGGYAAIEEPR